MKWETVYWDGAGMIGLGVFVATWGCYQAYGFLLGLGLGWLAALAAGVVAAFLWPFIAVVIALMVLAYITGQVTL